MHISLEIRGCATFRGLGLAGALAHSSGLLPITGESEKPFTRSAVAWKNTDFTCELFGPDRAPSPTCYRPAAYMMVEFEHPMRRGTKGTDISAVAISCKPPGAPPAILLISNQKRCPQFIRWMLQC